MESDFSFMSNGKLWKGFFWGGIHDLIHVL